MNKRVQEKLVLKSSIKVFLSKIMLTTILFLLGMIITKQNPEIKDMLNKKIYEESFKFIDKKLNYEKYFGKILSLDKQSQKEKRVFSEKISYKKVEKYKNGAKLIVDNNYLVPTLESGVVIYVGTKDDYKDSIIVEQVNGIDMLYGNINISNIKLYDYIEKGSVIGETNTNELYLVGQKDGKYLEYQEYI